MTQATVANFSAGPGMVPREVLEQVKLQWLDWYHGMSVVEVSHRSEPVLELQASLETLLRDLLEIPDDFRVLMMHGGARAQFSAVPMNLLPSDGMGCYLVTGTWGQKAANSAQAFGQVETITVALEELAALSNLSVNEKATYLHVTDNETIEGIELSKLPVVGCPIVSDATSNILSKAIDWSKMHCVYASAQKNLGIAGATYVIVKQDWLQSHRQVIPDILSYQAHIDSNSMMNTPPVFAWYMTEKILQWVQSQGGVAAMEAAAMKRSGALYQAIDKSSFYHNSIPGTFRSKMNVPFSIQNNSDTFFEQAQEQGLFYLKGHRSVGGARASMYNAMPYACVESLIEFMSDFEKRNG